MCMLSSLSHLVLWVKMNMFSPKIHPKLNLLYVLMYLHLSTQDWIDISRYGAGVWETQNLNNNLPFKWLNVLLVISLKLLIYKFSRFALKVKIAKTLINLHSLGSGCFQVMNTYSWAEMRLYWDFLFILKCLCSWEIGVSLPQDLFLVHFRLNLVSLRSWLFYFSFKHFVVRLTVHWCLPDIFSSSLPLMTLWRVTKQFCVSTLSLPPCFFIELKL